MATASQIRTIYSTLATKTIQVESSVAYGTTTPQIFDLNALPDYVDSAKLPCRLLLPFALLLLLASSFGLPPVWKWAALSAQAGFYLVALLNPLIPEGSLIKRITSPCWTFVVLIAAALCGISVLFIPSRKLWKQTEVRQSSSAA